MKIRKQVDEHDHTTPTRLQTDSRDEERGQTQNHSVGKPLNEQWR